MKLCMGCMENIEDGITTCPYCGYDETTLRQESYYLEPGTIVGGKYIVGRVISYGGYTVTYLGMDAELNRKVLIKEYLPSDFSTRSEGEKEVTIYSGDALEQFEQGLTTFLNEANRIQHLQNVSGIAKVYDCVAENDTGYVIAEYLEGKTLKEILESGKTFSPEEAVNFISQILTGLCQVHPLDIVHCDISPETIMVTNTGEIKLLDFGATRYVTTANSKSLAIILKQGYAPEEQYRSQGVRGPWTDVYALAAVMYRMITGKVPMESVERALVDELKEPSQLGISIPENVENAMMNALNVYQKDRTQSAAAFLQELKSPQVKRIQVKKQKYETGRFPKWAKGLVAGLLCLVIAGGGYVGFKILGDQPKEQKSDTYTMCEFEGRSVSEAQKLAKELSEEANCTIELIENKGDFIYSTSKAGKILKQSVAVGETLKQGATYKVNYTLGVNDKVHYSDINMSSNVNYLLDVMSLKEDKTKKEENAEKEYWSVNYIELKDGGKTITFDDLRTHDNKVLNIKDIKYIHYYVSKFFYWKALPDFVGKNIYALPKYTLYDNPEKPKETTSQKQLSAITTLYDTNYISFEKDKGYIFSQTKKAGKEFNQAREKSTLLKVVGKKGSYAGKTGQKVHEEYFDNDNFTIIYTGSENKNHTVTNVNVRYEGQNVTCFPQLPNEKYTVTITTQAPATEAPVTQKPAAKNSQNRDSEKTKININNY